VTFVSSVENFAGQLWTGHSIVGMDTTNWGGTVFPARNRHLLFARDAKQEGLCQDSLTILIAKLVA
jgi:hypothetical protein